MAKELFGTDGIRGIPGEYPLDDATLDRVGLALGNYLRSQESAHGESPRVLIGRDTRESGPHIAERIACGLAAGGANPVSAGVLTTPGVAWLVNREGFAAGVVISASHNPYHDNGVKLISSTGMKFPDAIEAALEQSVLSSRDIVSTATALRLHDNEKIDDDYLEGLAQAILPGAKLAGMKIVLDCANGAASNLAPRLFRSLGADVTAINHTPDGKNINANCGSLHPESMQKRVVECGAALGVAFDGDADRAVFSSATGKLVDGDGVLFVVARYLKSVGKLETDVVVGTSMANLGLERALESAGLKLARTAVGDRYVLEEMRRIGAKTPSGFPPRSRPHTSRSGKGPRQFRPRGTALFRYGAARPRDGGSRARRGCPPLDRIPRRRFALCSWRLILHPLPFVPNPAEKSRKLGNFLRSPDITEIEPPELGGRDARGCRNPSSW
jgi:phosphoglucosamine mutase